MAPTHPSRSDDVHVQLTHDVLATTPFEPMLVDPDTGAHAWFLGVTRRTTLIHGATSDAGSESASNEDIRVTDRLHYEANETMAEKMLRALALETLEEFALSKIVLVHRLGEVPIGEASVIVGCSSAHRVACFQALPWVMDRLKADVPIWKRETYVDGKTEWVHPDSECS